MTIRSHQKCPLNGMALVNASSSKAAIKSRTGMGIVAISGKTARRTFSGRTPRCADRVLIAGLVHLFDDIGPLVGATTSEQDRQLSYFSDLNVANDPVAK